MIPVTLYSAVAVLRFIITAHVCIAAHPPLYDYLDLIAHQIRVYVLIARQIKV